jgi:hypothetical protein
MPPGLGLNLRHLRAHSHHETGATFRLLLPTTIAATGRPTTISNSSATHQVRGPRRK